MITTFHSKQIFGTKRITQVAIIDFFIRIQSHKAAQHFIEKHPYLQHLNEVGKRDLQGAYIATLNKPEAVSIRKRNQIVHVIPFGNGFDELMKKNAVLKTALIKTLDRVFKGIPVSTPVHIRLDYLFLITDTSSRQGLWMLNYLAAQPHTITIYV